MFVGIRPGSSDLGGLVKVEKVPEDRGQIQQKGVWFGKGKQSAPFDLDFDVENFKKLRKSFVASFVERVVSEMVSPRSSRGRNTWFYGS